MKSDVISIGGKTGEIGSPHFNINRDCKERFPVIHN